MAEGTGRRSSARDPESLRPETAATCSLHDLRAEADPDRVGPFRIVGRLGHGGMGIVYRALDESLQREVALKVLPIRHAQDAERRQRFLREARAAASLVHPNVAVVYQVGEADGRDYFAMELVEGVTLRRWLEGGAHREEREEREDTVRALAIQMAQGLAAAHRKRIVHRDFKPENVMVDESGIVKLLDFGLAKPDKTDEDSEGFALADTEAQITKDGIVIGSTPYMSPEQAMGLPVDARSDVFSFGIVFYEMLAGRRPFLGRTPGEVRATIARDPPLPLAGVSAALERLVMRCLQKRPEDRFEDAGAITQALSIPPPPPESRPRAEWIFPRPTTIESPSPVPSEPVERSVAAGSSEVKGLWFVVARRYMIETYSRDMPERVASRVPPELRGAILDPMRSAWYPEACLQQFMRAFDAEVTNGDPRALLLAFEACTMQGLNRFFRAALRMTSPDFLLRKSPTLWKLVRRNQGNVSVETNSERAIVRYSDFPYFDDVNYRLLALGTLRQLAAFGSAGDPRAEELGSGRNWLVVKVTYR